MKEQTRAWLMQVSVRVSFVRRTRLPACAQHVRERERVTGTRPRGTTMPCTAIVEVYDIRAQIVASDNILSRSR